MQKLEPEILFQELPAQYGRLGIITLNRPEALNALSGTMIVALSTQLHLWAADVGIMAVIIQGAGDKAFCAGGDLKLVYNNGPQNYKELVPYFKTEYELNLYINKYPKPYIALLNGIAMGGGLGISIHGSRIIATERLQLAMPETAIGFYPDVGVGHVFARCPNYMGYYLALTGSTIGIADALLCELVSAYVPSTELSAVITAIAAQDLRQNALNVVDTVIASFKKDAPSAPLQQYQAIIANCFNQPSVEDILAKLQDSPLAWPQQQAAIFNIRCPTSLKVTLKLLQLAMSLDLEQYMTVEFNLAMQMFQRTDVYEGIRAALIDKTNDPKWQPATLNAVSESMLKQLFEIKCKL